MNNNQQFKIILKICGVFFHGIGSLKDVGETCNLSWYTYVESNNKVSSLN